MSGRACLLLAVLGVVVTSAVAAGCGSTSDRARKSSLAALETPAPPIEEPPKNTTREPRCGDPTASLRPIGSLPTPGSMPRGSFMRTIQDRGRMIAGVDQNTLLFGYLDPFTGDFRGLEIELLHRLAQAIFGDPTRVEFKAVTTKQRLPYVEDGSVDLVADAVTIKCSRRQIVSFSTVYYDAGQRLLVPSNSSAHGLGDLSGMRVCVTAGSTADDHLQALEKLPSHPITYPRPQRTDCLVALQEGTVAAIASDDAILLGLNEQDPYTKLVGPRFTDEPYGIAIARGHPEFVRFVNAVLARMRADGSLAALYRKWLGTSTGGVPPAHYRD